MKARMKWIVALVAVVVGVVWLLGDRAQADGEEPAAEGDRVANLEQEVQTLRETVARLEQRLATVEEQNSVKVWHLPDGASGRLPPPAGEARTPLMQKYRPQGEINGIPYYVIPLKGPGWDDTAGN